MSLASATKLFFEEVKMKYITTSKDPPSTRCTRV